MRTCNRCGQTLPADLFVTYSGARAPSCKPCRIQKVRTSGERFSAFLESLPPDRRAEIEQAELADNNQRESKLRRMGRI